MLKLFNTLGKKIELFRPLNKKVVNMFTCGPSVYQRAHIGNFRTFLFEDILIRYLEYSGYTVKRGMNFTDIEDKSIKEAKRKKTTVERLTEKNIKEFIEEMNLLRMKIPAFLPRASECVNDAAEIIKRLLDHKIAYWHKGDVFFDPLQFPGFGKLYGLDMSKWPSKKKRFYKDTYPGMQWNLGDFILWHGCKADDTYCWDTSIGKGRPSWNIQDPSMITKYFHETLSLYCGGIDNLFRHHDYTMAILDSFRPYPVAKYWLHCNHLSVNGQKMSKSKGNIIYTDTLQKQGYDMTEIRFFLIYGQYHEKLYYSETSMLFTGEKLRSFRRLVRNIKNKSNQKPDTKGRIAKRLKTTFADNMDNDLNVQGAFDGLYNILSGIKADNLSAAEAAGIIETLQKIDKVFRVIF